MIAKVFPECEQSDCHGECENPTDGRGMRLMLDHTRPLNQMKQALGEVTLLTLGVPQFNAWEVPDDDYPEE